MKIEDFLHAISSPLSGVEFMLDSIEGDIRKSATTGDVQEKLKIAFEGLKKIRNLIKKAREEDENGK